MASEKLRKYLAYYQKVLREDPENIEARLRLAAIFREMGRKNHAVEEYVTASKLLARDGLPLEAIAACKAVLELDPKHTEIQFFLARLFAQVPEATGHAGRVARPVLGLIEPQPTHTYSIPTDTKGFDVSETDLDASLIELKQPKFPKATEETRNENVLQTVWDPQENAARENTRRESQPAREFAETEENLSMNEITEVEEDESQETILEISALRRTRDEDLFATQDIDPADIIEERPDGFYVREREDTVRLPSQIASDLITSVERTETIELGVFDMSSLELGEDSIEFELPELDELDEVSEDLVLNSPPRVLNVRRSDLPEIPLFSRLTQEAFLDLLNVVNVREVAAGEVLLSPEEERRALYILVRGEVEVWREEGGKRIHLDMMQEGNFFGEFQLLTGRVGRATVSAHTDVRVLELSESVLNSLGERNPEVWDVLWEFFFRRMLNNLLATSTIFRGLTAEERTQMASRFSQEEHLAGDIITREGEFNDQLFLVLSGEVVVERDLGGITQNLAQMKEGEFLGVASTLAQEPYPADVRAVRDSVLLCLSGDEFRQLVDTNVHVAREVQREMRKRRALNSQFSSGITTYAELGVTRED